MPKDPKDNPLYRAMIDTMYNAAVSWLLVNPNARLAFRTFDVEVIAALEPAVIKLYGLTPHARELLGVLDEASEREGTLSMARAVVARLGEKGLIKAVKEVNPNAN